MRLVPEFLKDTVSLRFFSFFNIHLIYHIQPSVVELTDRRVVVKVPLTRRTRNHLKSMYFGTMAIGADCAAGLIAMNLIREEGNKVSLVFKDLKANFLKRAEGDVHFICEQGKEIKALVKKALGSETRQNLPVHITAVVPKIDPNEPVAEFILTLSLKRKN